MIVANSLYWHINFSADDDSTGNNDMNIIGSRKAAFITCVSILVIVLALTLSDIAGTHAQENTSKFQSILEQLDKEMQQEPNLQVAMKFNSPVDSDPVWILPRMGEGENQVTRTIEQIGLDYVCFIESGGTTKFRECTLFSNIASIRYLIE